MSIEYYYNCKLYTELPAVSRWKLLRGCGGRQADAAYALRGWQH